MQKQPKKKKLLDDTLASETLRSLGSRDINKTSRLGDILDEFHENSFAIVMVLFNTPMAIPWPPGFTTVFALPLLIIAIQMSMGLHKLHLPKWIKNLEVKNSTLSMIAQKTIPIFLKVEKHLKPRYKIFQSVYGEQLVGLISIPAALAIAIPLPLTNGIPAIGIVIMCLGLLKRDGLVVLIGIAATMIGLCIAFFAPFILYSLLTSSLAVFYKIMSYFTPGG
jgi:hypothetical protein